MTFIFRTIKKEKKSCYLYSLVENYEKEGRRTYDVRGESSNLIEECSDDDTRGSGISENFAGTCKCKYLSCTKGKLIN